MSASTSDLSDLFFRILPQAMRSIKSDIRQSDFDIDPLHLHLIDLLLEREHSLGELADVVGVSAPTMSNSITALETRGWVERRRSQGDRRRVKVRATSQGAEVRAETQAYLRSRFAETLCGLSEEERSRLGDGLRVLATVFAGEATSTHGRRSPVPQPS